MTDVGKITLGVDLDADDLTARLGEAVRRAIAPALADIQRELNKVQREQEKTTRVTQREAAKQAAAEHALGEAVERVGEQHTKQAAKASAAGGISTRSINSVTRALNKQAAAWTALAAAQSAAAAAPQPTAPSSRGGSGGGGPPGGVNSGGFMRGGKGTFGFLTSPVGLNLGALGASALPAVTTAVTNLVGAVQALAQAGLVLPGVFAGVASSIGVAAIGFKGMGDAVKALNEAAKSGDPKDLEKVAEALKDMDPAAVAVAKTFSALTQGPLKDLQKMVAGRMFAGFDRDLQGLADRAIPRVSTGFGKIADSWNSTLKTITGSLGSDRNLSIMDRIFGNTAEGQRRANAAIDPLIHGFGTLAAAGTDFLPRLADGLTKLATRFDEFISKADGDGRLAGWIDTGFKAAANFGEALLNIGKIITNITGAAGGDGGFLKWLRDVTGQFAAFTGSAEGQEKLSKFFTEGKEKLDQWLPVIIDLVKLIGDVVAGFQQWGDIILPVISQILGALTALGGEGGGIIGTVVTGFLALKTLGGLGSLLTSLTGINTQLGGIANNAGGIGKKGGLAKMLLGVGGLAVGSELLGDPNASGVEKAGGALSNIAGGALLGSQFGPIGTAIGGVVGALKSIFDTAKAELDRGKKEFEDYAESKRTPEERKKNDEAMREQGKGPEFFNPSLKTPTIQADLLPKIRAGQLPGYSIGPDGRVVGPNGQAINLPGSIAPIVPPPPPPPPPLPAPVKEQITQGTPVAAGAPGADVKLEGTAIKAKAAFDNVQLLANAVRTLPDGNVVLKDNSPEAIKRVEDLGYAVKQLPDGQVSIQVQYMLDGAPISRAQLVTPIRVAATPGGTPVRGGGGRALGGPIWGGTPGRDSVPIMAMPGEHMLTVADVNALGGQQGVYAMRAALHGARRYADGGAVPHLGTGLPPGPDSTSEIGVLLQIRDLLAGKGGSGPLVDTADAVGQIATAQDGTATGGGGTVMGPFGTPLKKKGNPAYDAAAAAISALGGDPEKFIGMDPSTYVAPGAALPGQAAGAGAIDPSRYAAALTSFAMSGNAGSLAAAGLDANDPVVRAITTARNKKTGGLTDEQISGLVTDVFDGGFTGTLDGTNSPLIAALQTYREKLAKGGVGTRGTATTSTSAASMMTPLPTAMALPGAGTGAMDPLSAFAQSVSGGKYQWGGSDLAAGLSDCSGAVSDLVEIITKGQADSGRLFSTADARSVLTGLGAVDGAIPGALQIGWSDTHMRSTLPNGVAFESGGGTGQGATYGGNAKGAEGMPNIMSLPAGSVTPQMLAGLTGQSLPGSGGGQGTPVYVTNWPGQGGMPPGAQQVLGGLFQGGGEAANNVIGDVMGAVSGLGQEGWGKRQGDASVTDLIKDRNPLAFAAAAGLKVQDFTRNGGDGNEFDRSGEKYDASGRLFSDTAALSDRTVTDLDAQLNAMREQLVDVIEQVSEKLNDQALEPVVKAGVQSALESLKDSVSGAIGTALGNAAAPPIADAVSSAVSSLPIDQSGSGGVGGNAAGVVGGVLGFASGGPVNGGTAGKDSVPAMLMPGEYVLNRGQVARMGGFGNIDRIGQGVRHYATGGGVVVNDSVGAEFFGVSEVPIIGAIVNLLVRVLLQVIGVEIEARDTMNEMSDEFRQFRGDAFKAFDAQGRLMNDTSALIERSQSSSEAAAEERIRILKIVIQALIKYIIEKVIVPITKAVANAAIQAGASAAGAATNTGAPGAGGIVSSLISSAGQAGVDIAAEVGTDFALAMSEQLINVVTEGFSSLFPDLMTGLFSGAGAAGLFDPFGGFLTTLLGGFFGSFAALLGGGLGGASTLIPGIPFDNGGIASGKGFLPKAVDADELVLSPTETDLFPRLVAALERNGFGSTTRSVHAPITVIGGGRETAEQVSDRLLKLMP